MRSNALMLGLAAVLIGPLAVAQTSSPSSAATATPSTHAADQSTGAKEQQSERKTCTGSDTSNINCKEKSTATHRDTHSSDQSSGAKEQQSERRPCTGSDHTNVNCKEKQGNSSNSSNPKR